MQKTLQETQPHVCISCRQLALSLESLDAVLSVVLAAMTSLGLQKTDHCPRWEKSKIMNTECIIPQPPGGLPFPPTHVHCGEGVELRLRWTCTCYIPTSWIHAVKAYIVLKSYIILWSCLELQVT